MPRFSLDTLPGDVIEHLQDGILVTDADTRILYVNQAFVRMTGYAAEEAHGETPRILRSGHHDAAFYRRMWALIREEGQWSGEIWHRHKDGASHPKRLTVTAIPDGRGGVRNYVGVISDISDLVHTRREAEHSASHDPLTGLPNWLLFKDRVGHALERAERLDHQVALIFLDIDHFKDINESLGHTIGDRLLQRMAERLKQGVRAEDTLARLAGDRFNICLERVDGPEEAFAMARRLHLSAAEPLQLGPHALRLPCSAGISVYPRDGATVEQLMRNADSALHSAKEAGRNAIRFYTEDLTRRADQRLNLAQELQEALDRDQLTIFYQSQIDMAEGGVTGVEALVRWNHPEQGVLGPGSFIPLAEEMGLMPDLGKWVLRMACRRGQEWLEDGYRFGRVAVNISARQVREGNLAEVVRECLRESGLPPKYLELEITESALMELDNGIMASLCAIRDLGVRLAIDDFGTGYSSLLYLKRLPVSKLKIDRGFVQDMANSVESRGIVRAVIALARTLGLDLVAEGVETEAQRDLLLEDEVRVGQGFLWSRPVPFPELPQAAARGRRSTG